MKREELLAWLRDNLDEWPARGGVHTQKLPEGCLWEMGGLSHCWMAWPKRGFCGREAAINEREWKAVKVGG